jgi:hypothetical protein
MIQPPPICRLLLLVLLTIATALPARAWYDPGQGRWCSRDPIGEQGGVNLYGLVDNDCVTRVDVVGLYPTVEEAIRAGYTEAAVNTLKDYRPSPIQGLSINREWCGIVCEVCDEKTGVRDYVPTKPHPGLWSVPVRQRGTVSVDTRLFKNYDEKGFTGEVQFEKGLGGSCNPLQTVHDDLVKCPKGKFAGTYHSHPINRENPGTATPSSTDMESGEEHGRPWGVGEVGKGSDGKASIINGKIIYPNPPDFVLDIPGWGDLPIHFPKNLIVPQSPIPVRR